MYKLKKDIRRIKNIRNKIEKEWSEKYFNFILDHINEHFDWKEISQNPNITSDILINNTNLPWVLSYVSRNPNFTIKVKNKLDFLCHY